MSVLRVCALSLLSVTLAACQDSAPAEAADETHVQENPTVLDLELDDRVLVDQVETLAEPDPVLPDLFDGTAEQRKTKVSGKVLTDEEAQLLQDKVDGVELKIEVQTGSD